MAQIGTDLFNGPDGPLSASWTTPAGGHALVIDTSTVISTQASVYNIQYWNADAFPDDQYSQVVIHTVDASAFLGPVVRQFSGSSYNGYATLMNGTFGLPGVFYLVKLVEGVQTILGQVTGPVINAGDVLRIEVHGTALSVFHNGVHIDTLDTTDSDLTSGSAGVAQIFVGSVLDGSFVGPWSGGDFTSGFSISGTTTVNSTAVVYTGPVSGDVTADSSGNYVIDGLTPGDYVITPFVVFGPFTPTHRNETITDADLTGVDFALAPPPPDAFSFTDSRNYATFPNSSRDVQATLIYDVQTSSNSSVPSVDSRAAGAPVDSRADGGPQNSRVDPSTVSPD